MPAHIVLAWELGHGFGHALPLAALARPLLEAGHRLSLIARDPAKMRKACAGLPVRILCAPSFPGVAIPAQQQNSLADVIWFEAGGHDASVFTALLLAWRELLQAIGADLLVADAAPAALAAAQGLLPTLCYDNGFHVGDAAGWGIFRDWERANTAASAQRAEGLLVHLNAARAAAGLAPVASLSGGFGADRTLIRFPPELDHAAPRQGVRHVGQPTVPGAVPQWPPSPQPRRLFVYLRKDYVLADRLLAGLARLQHTQVLCFHDGLPADRCRAAPHLAYAQTPLDLSLLLPQVDAVVCHGGGLQALALQYGKPALALPLHTEQFLSARQAERAGCGLLYLARGERPDFLPMLRELLDRSVLAERAREIAQAQRDREPAPLAAAVAEIEALLAVRVS